METNASIRIGTLGAVFKITFDGTTNRCQLTTYLVMATCLQVDFQKGIMFALHKSLVGQDRQFGFFGTGFGNKRFVERLIARQVVLQAGFRLFGTPLHDRPVRFTNLLVTFEHLVKTGEGFAGSGKEYYSTRWAIQTMGNTEKDLTGLVVLVLDVGLDDLAQRCVARLIALHDLVAGLINGNNMVVFV